MNVTLVILASTIFGQVRVEPEQVERRFVGQRIVIDGVVSSIVSDKMQMVRLKNCPARFFLKAKSIDARTQNVEFAGLVSLDRDDLIVHVDSFQVLPGDLERFRQRGARLPANDAAGWFELAEWAERRAKLYGENALLPKVVEAYRTGISVARKQAGDSPSELTKLSERIQRDARLPDYDLNELHHEILHLELKKHSLQDATAFDRFADTVHSQLLAQAPTDVPTPSQRLRDGYDVESVSLYRRSSTEIRRQLARYWEVTLRRDGWQLRHATNSATALAIARLAETSAPDYPDIARLWYRRWTEELQDRLENLSEGEVAELAELTAVKLDQRPEGEDAIRNWLKRREEKFRLQEGAPEQRDARARLQLAELYLKFAADPQWQSVQTEFTDKAVEVLQEANSVDSKFDGPVKLLTKLGYRRQPEGVWTKGAAALPPPRAAPRNPVSIHDGMAASEILKTLGQPDLRSRVLTRNSGDDGILVTHQWCYRGVSGTIYVTLVEDQRGNMRVSAWKNQVTPSTPVEP